MQLAPFVLDYFLSDDWVVYSKLILDKLALAIVMTMLYLKQPWKQSFKKRLVFVIVVVSWLLLLNCIGAIMLADYEIEARLIYQEVTGG